MDVRVEPFWTIDEIAIWARCRDIDVVNLLGTPALDGRHAERREYIELRMAHAATASRAGGRNIERELWEASGWPMPLGSLIEPSLIPGGQSGSKLFVGKDFSPEWRALNKAYEMASPSDRRHVADALDLSAAGRSDPELVARLPPPFDVLIADALRQRAASNGSIGQLLIFPLTDYLLRLFRTGQMKAVGNLPGEPLEREIYLSGWRGLTIATANDNQRLCVWRVANMQRIGDGDIEDVRVARDAVLKAFPADPPPPPKPPPLQPTEEDARRVIREGMASRGGFISQKNGARIVRSVFPKFNATRAMELTKELTGNTSPGPRGPRGKLSQ